MPATSPPDRDSNNSWAKQIELRRKVLHLLGLIAPLSVVVWGKWPTVIVLGLGSLIALTGQFLQVRSARFNEWIHRRFGSMMRENERRAVGEPIVLNGATWMTISALLTFLCFSAPIGIAAFTLAILGDTAAAFVGIRYGRHTILGSRKTIEGSCAFLGTALLVVIVLPELAFWQGAVGALAATLAEASAIFVNDNLLVPLVSGAVMSLL